MGFKHFGIMMDGNLKNLNKLNLASVLFLYLFQSLTIAVPPAFFSSLDKLTRRFIWHGKIPRVSLGKLTLDKLTRRFIW
ncbi:unnamed protein product, partial [Coregonus sp. 'balchen']